MNSDDIKKALEKMSMQIAEGKGIPKRAILQKHQIRYLYRDKVPPKHIQELLDDESISEYTAISFST